MENPSRKDRLIEPRKSRSDISEAKVVGNHRAKY
jgi:hypothetical protein